MQLRRGAGGCSARVFILSFPSLSRARNFLRAYGSKNFRRDSLTKKSEAKLPLVSGDSPYGVGGLGTFVTHTCSERS